MRTGWYEKKQFLRKAFRIQAVNGSRCCNTGGAGCPIEETPETGRSPLLAI
jgi:hypothetical protein